MRSLLHLPEGRVPTILGDGVVVPFDGRRAVVVADEAVLGRVDRVVRRLGAASGPVVHVVEAGEPTCASVDRAVRAIRAVDEPVVVGIGGGSALDTAKLAASVSVGELDVEHYLLAAQPLPVGPTVVAVPTTSGTGSEATRTSVLAATSGRKVWAWGDELLPAYVLLDPELTATLPAHLTAATGLDAFVHAVEAATGRRADLHVVAPAGEAIELVVEYLPRAVESPGDLDARRAMQEAALLAGVAIDGGGTGIAHAIGHALGTLAHVPHGIAVATGLRAAMEWNLADSDGAYEPVATALGCAGNDAPARFDELLAECRFADVVRRVGPLAIKVHELASMMVADENLPMHHNNCRLADGDDRRQLATATLQRWAEWSA